MLALLIPAKLWQTTPPVELKPHASGQPQAQVVLQIHAPNKLQELNVGLIQNANGLEQLVRPTHAMLMLMNLLVAKLLLVPGLITNAQ